jgi:hypothetical protein
MRFGPDPVREFERAGWNRAAAAYETTFATASRQFIAPLLDAAAFGPEARALDLCRGPGFAGATATGLGFSPAITAPRRDDAGLAVPIACIIAAGTRP